jgi:hypothetical protein
METLDFNSNYSTDAKLSCLDDILRCLGFCLTQHVSLWLEKTKLIEQQVSSLETVDAGLIFNIYSCSENKNENFLSDEEFKLISTSFFQCAKSLPKLSIQIPQPPKSLRGIDSKTITDGPDLLFEFLRYFICPIRLDHSTLPSDLKYKSLKIWLVLCFTFPFIEKYNEKWGGYLNNIELLNQIKQRFIADHSKITDFKQKINCKQICDLLTPSFKTSSVSTIFIKSFLHVLLLISQEIIKKYCPCYGEVNGINPNYDGAWLSPFDSLYCLQVQKIKNLDPIVETNKMK